MKGRFLTYPCGGEKDAQAKHLPGVRDEDGTPASVSEVEISGGGRRG